MITDTVLSSLINLFVLFCITNNVNIEISKKMLSIYLSRHFGINNKDEYISLFSDLYKLYNEVDDLDADKIVDDICKNLKNIIKHEECAMLLLRLMEFCAKNVKNFDSNDNLFLQAVNCLDISENLFSDFCDYLTLTESNNVKITKFEGFKDNIVTLYIREFNSIIFTYNSNDANNVKLNDIPIIKGLYFTFPPSGVLRNKNGKPIYFSTILNLYNKDNIENKISFIGEHIEYIFPNSNNGIHDFSFSANNNELIAIMGCSGCGKTTLMSILNGNIKPKKGNLTINGYSLYDKKVKHLIGYVPQDDILIEELTVYQNLYYTTKLCFSNISEQEIKNKIYKILKDFDLFQIKDLKVGSPINKVLSGGQRKRLNIAIELIREPYIVFLDEPTSGLSSSDAEKIILLLKELTYNGKLVIINIHQPSSNIYKLFDKLWVLDKGGYPIFNGNPIDAITYFKSVANYADDNISTCPICGNICPEIIFNIIEDKLIDNNGKLTSIRKITPEQWHKIYIEHVKINDIKKLDLPEIKYKKPNKIKQCYIYLLRNITSKITNIEYINITFLISPILAIICSLFTQFTPIGQVYTLIDNKNLVLYFFISIIVSTFIGMCSSAEEIIHDKIILIREKFLQLSYGSYICSKIIYLGCISLIQTGIYILIGNSILGIHNLFLLCWCILFIVSFIANLTGLILSQTLKTIVPIYIIIPLLIVPQILLSGLVIDFSDIDNNRNNNNVPFIGNIIPSRWAFEAITTTYFINNEYEKHFFKYDKEKYENQYYSLIYIEELLNYAAELNNNKINNKHLGILKHELLFISKYCNIKKYNGKYDYYSIKNYLLLAKEILLKKSNNAELLENEKMEKLVTIYGNNYIANLRKNSCNKYIENLVINKNNIINKQFIKEDNKQIIPNFYNIYITPRTYYGNAPFYSSVKCIGNFQIKTFYFNMYILSIMCIILIVCLIYKIPINVLYFLSIKNKQFK